MSETVTVNVVQGTLRGRKTTSSTGGTYYSFLGVPYAKPPIGPLRFKDPEPPESWTGVRDALQEGEMCTQLEFLEKVYKGSEDCLYLNVCTPQLPENIPETTLMPVIFLIHGGGFVGGSGNIEIQDPVLLVGEKMVVVSITYRVGVLGFLCVDGPACPGNMGLKDQVAALRWVQQNVAKFGGDPNNVTIMGASAGSASVHYLLLSPMAKGLFHRAAGSGGAVLNPWALTREPQYMAFQLGAALGCVTEDPEELVEYLRTVDHLALVKAVTNDVLPDREKQRIFPFLFTPTLEVEVDGIERFLPASPLQLLEEGRFTAVPTITGIGSEEALVFIAMLNLTNPEVQTKLEDVFDKAILPELRLPENYSSPAKAVSKLRHFYLKDKPLSKETLPGFISLISDVMFGEGAITTVKKLAQHAKAPVYLYCFSHEGQIWKIFPKVDHPGAAHVEDYCHFIQSKYVQEDLPPEHLTTRARLLKMYTDFAKIGNPTPEETDLVPITWQPHTASNPCYLDIDKELSMKTNLFGERMAFWDELYKPESM